MQFQIQRLLDRFRLKRRLVRNLLEHTSNVGVHLLHATEHVHHCFYNRVRSVQYYNEVMRSLERVAEDCALVRDKVLAVGISSMTWSRYVEHTTVVRAMVDKLRYIYRTQGAPCLKHVIDIECTDHEPLDWWQEFVNTSFVPLSYEMFGIGAGAGAGATTAAAATSVVAHPMNPMCAEGAGTTTGATATAKLQFATYPAKEPADTGRIATLVNSWTLENCCHRLRPPATKPVVLLGSGGGSGGGGTDAAASSKADESESSSLIEHIHGARVYVVVEKHRLVVAMNGYFKNDSFQTMANHLPLLAKRNQLHQLLTHESSHVPEAFAGGWAKQVSLRDQLVYSATELNARCTRGFQKLQELKGKTISTLVKEFMSSSTYKQRDVLTLFLLTEHDSDTQYLAYLMYDMISQESCLLKPQPLAEEIYNHLHWNIKKQFRNVVDNIGQYTKKISNFKESDMKYESRILLMKADDSIKKKAMEKLKEVQSPNGAETNHKAQQYLDGILRIPFGYNKKEHIFSFLTNFRERLRMLGNQHATDSTPHGNGNGNGCGMTYHQIDAYLGQLETGSSSSSSSATATATAVASATPPLLPPLTPPPQHHHHDDEEDELERIRLHLSQCTYAELGKHLKRLKHVLAVPKLSFVVVDVDDKKTETNANENAKKPKPQAVCMRRKLNANEKKMTPLPPAQIVADCMRFCAYTRSAHPERWSLVVSTLAPSSAAASTAAAAAPPSSSSSALSPHTAALQAQLHGHTQAFQAEWGAFKEDAKGYLTNVDTILDASLFGNDKAKRSIKQVIAQWITGESKGYCFGFEGPPGTGKTSLAKNGVSKCLVDLNGEIRPFAFIALGGSSNGSTLEGHSYTYVGSIWGRIVDILMETQCMNPIIYVDELDKISRTEHGRELVGILTHLTDSTQNSEFMDKYFAGIRIDLSKVLFIFSYNDPSLLDPVLRDRIHVIKFEPLKQADKHEVCRLHLLPEIIKTIGMAPTDLVFPAEVVDHIIDHYTAEGGVRRLKEKLFDISRDLNIRHMLDETTYKFPYTVTKAFLTDDLFAQHPVVPHKCIMGAPRVGLVNGMYATTSGVGGITIIECFVVPKTAFLALELTGQQGDVMKESMSVARTVAWSLLTEATKAALYAKSKENSFGLHIHCPDGGTPKDGPSAGTAITISILSSLLNLPVNHEVAITGEIDLNGQVCQIGGLDTKVRGAKKAGVKRVLFPKTNAHDLQTIQSQHSPFADGTLAHTMVDTIWDVLPYVFPTSTYDFQRP